MRALARPSSVVGFAVLASIAVRSLTERLADPDLWWHLRTGELIATTRSIPTQDVFSYTAEGASWTVQEWGAELILHGLREAFGLWGIVAYKAVVLVAIYAVVARIVVRHMGSGMGAWALIGLAAYAGASNWTERPNLLSFLLFVLTLDLLDRRSERALWLFVPICALWANLHGMVLVGLGSVLVVAAGETFKVVFEGADGAWARRVWQVWALGLGATLLNPRFGGLYEHAFGLLDTVRGVVTEWASPDFHQVGTFAFVGLVLLTVVVLATRARRADTTDLLLVIAFTFLALQAARNLAIAGIVLGVVVARALGRSNRESPASVPLAIASYVAVGVAFAAVLAARMPTGSLIDQDYPVAAIDALPAGARVFAYDVWAPMVIERAWPDAHVFFDTRSDVYGIDGVERYQHTIAAFPDWSQNLEGSCTTHVLIRETDPLNQVLSLSTDWRMASADEGSVTWTRAKPGRGCPAPLGGTG